jgi:diketogulonate reductase-like aldo/keto reductase
MKFESVSGVTLPKLGFGTWKIGGNSAPDHSLDARSLAALRCALEVGYTHIDTAEMYAAGHAEEFIRQALAESGVARETIIITSKVLPSHLSYPAVLKACENSLRRLGSEYIDLYLIHWPMVGMRLQDTFRALNQLVREQKVKHLGVSNFNVKLLKESQKWSETPILTDQVPYSLTERSYVKNGVLEYCRKNNILLTAYEPVDKGHLTPGSALRAVAAAHAATVYQIALAWLTAQPGVITIPMSFDPGHIRENFAAPDIALSEAELRSLG